MAGTAPIEFQFTRTRDAGPVHCSVWLSRLAIANVADKCSNIYNQHASAEDCPKNE
jgi:hypothetical protein